MMLRAGLVKKLVPYRVIYGDTDQMGVAYYANYLRWFEMGRSEWLREAGTPYPSIEARGLFFPVSEATCRYLRPARYDEPITIETELASLGRASLVFSYRVRGGDGLLLAEGKTKHACVDRRGRVCRIPVPLKERLSSYLDSPGSGGGDPSPGEE
jgi:acyl-CoA thioester hydrolase